MLNCRKSHGKWRIMGSAVLLWAALLAATDSRAKPSGPPRYFEVSGTMGVKQENIRENYLMDGWFGKAGRVEAEYHDPEQTVLVNDPLYRLQYTFRFQPEGIFALAKLNSNSDKPFHSSKEMNFQFIFAYQISGDKTQGLLIGGEYSYRRPFLNGYPIPLIMYQIKTGDLYLFAGIPFMVHWQMSDRFSFHFFYLLVLDKINAAFRYRVGDKNALILQSQWKQDRYFLAERAEEDFSVFHQKGEIGLRWEQEIWNKVNWNVYAGYTFHESYHAGKDFKDQQEKVTLENSFQIETSIKLLY